MKNRRRDFIKLTGMTTLGIASAGFSNAFGTTLNYSEMGENFSDIKGPIAADSESSIIGAYGQWAAGLNGNKLPALSFRKQEFNSIDSWKKSARQRLNERLSVPDIGGLPKVTIKKQYTYDGLHVEELSWQLPYGSATDAILLKPMNVNGKLPGILAFHDHAGLKYFGTRKITRVSDELHPLMAEHQKGYYEDRAWANEVAKRG
jgi:hypothetical protein